MILKFRSLIGPNSTPINAKQAILDYLGSEGNLDLLTRYTEIYAKWADVADRLTTPKTGVNSQYEEANRRSIS